MYQFVNSFSLASNEKNSEVLFKFNQLFTEPDSTMVTEDVADLVMPGELAHSLALKILEVFGEIETTED